MRDVSPATPAAASAPRRVAGGAGAVSYTHLDVYKRQVRERGPCR
ncbi:hypothetical protein [Streptomyces fragilis]|nr:hypothetical protein [Streptomyces fragilis]